MLKFNIIENSLHLSIIEPGGTLINLQIPIDSFIDIVKSLDYYHSIGFSGNVIDGQNKFTNFTRFTCHQLNLVGFLEHEMTNYAHDIYRLGYNMKDLSKTILREVQINKLLADE